MTVCLKTPVVMNFRRRMRLRYTKHKKLSTRLWNKATYSTLIHWGRVAYIRVGKLTIIGSDNGLSPERHRAIIWTNAGTLLIGPLGTIFSEIVIEIQTFFSIEENTFKNVVCEMLFISSRPQCVNFMPFRFVWSFLWLLLEHRFTLGALNCALMFPTFKESS